MRTKEDIWINQCDKCGKTEKEGELCHSDEFGGAICGDCQKEEDLKDEE